MASVEIAVVDTVLTTRKGHSKAPYYCEGTIIR
jgi:hypothetical protein